MLDLQREERAPQVAQGERATPEGILAGYIEVFLVVDPKRQKAIGGAHCSSKAFNLLLVS